MGFFDDIKGKSVLNAASSVGSGLIGLYGASKQREFESQEAEKQRQWSESQVANQNAWNYRLWLETNEYNSPAARKQRLQESGLNPLYFGLDGSSAEGLTSAQPLGYDRASAANFTNPIQSGFDAAIKTAQISNIQANTAKTGEETLTEVQRREKLMAEIDNTKQQLENLRSQKNLTDAQVKDIEKKLEWVDRLNEATISAKEADAALSESQKKRIDTLLAGEKKIQDATIEDFNRRWEKIDAEIKKMAAETSLTYEDIANYALNHTSNGFMGSGVSVQNFVRLLRGERTRKHSKGKPLDTSSSEALVDSVGNTD